MPRIKKFRFNITKKRSVTTTALPPSPILATPPTTTMKEQEVGGGCEDVPLTQTPQLLSSADLLPHLVCVVCYSQFPYYTLSCVPWEAAVTKDFYVALNIPEDDAVGGLPFCPECHSKVAVMFSLHQQLQNILQSFNCIRNDIAFTVVDSIGQNCRKGPMDLIRQKIYKRWKELHAKAKEIGSGDVYDPDSTLAYLTPKLSVADDLPADPTTMSLSEGAKKKLVELRKTPAALGVGTTAANPQQQHKPKNGGQLPISEVVGGTEMPKLEPMAKLVPNKPHPGRGRPIRKVGVGGFGQSRIMAKIGRKRGLISHHKSKLKLNKLSNPSSSSPSASSSNWNKFQLINHFKPNSEYRKKAPKRLANGRWKCNYCPITYGNAVCVSQHESRCHPQTRPFLCTMCPKGFLTLDGVRKHLQAMHTEVVQGYVKCPFCQRHFSRKTGFKQHIAQFHKGRKPVPDFDLLMANPPSTVVSVPQSISLPTPAKKRRGRQPRGDVVITHVPLPQGSPPSPEITDLEVSQPQHHKKNNTSPGGKKLRGRPSVKVPLKEVEDENIKTLNGGSVYQDSITTPSHQTVDDVENEESVQIDGVGKNNSLKMKEEALPLEKEAKIEEDSIISADDATTTPLNQENEDVLPAKRRRTSVLYNPPPQRKSRSLGVDGKKTTKELIACPTCGKKFLGPHALAGHSKLHRGMKPSNGDDDKGAVSSTEDQKNGVDEEHRDKNGILLGEENENTTPSIPDGNAHPVDEDATTA